MTLNLFSTNDNLVKEDLAPGAAILRGLAAREDIDAQLLTAVSAIDDAAPFRHLTVPGGYSMSVGMTNCGKVGWVSDTTGYRYDPIDPLSGAKWPEMPEIFQDLAGRAAALVGFENYRPDACLINRYSKGTKLSLHIDKDEEDPISPIVSVSLGIPATFLWGGFKRADKTDKLLLNHGDVVVWGGPSRMRYHGVSAIKNGYHPLTGNTRINLTFRKVFKP